MQEKQIGGALTLRRIRHRRHVFVVCRRRVGQDEASQFLQRIPAEDVFQAPIPEPRRSGRLDGLQVLGVPQDAVKARRRRCRRRRSVADVLILRRRIVLISERFRAGSRTWVPGFCDVLHEEEVDELELGEAAVLRLLVAVVLAVNGQLGVDH